jgi:tellurite resistance protein TehA-like permease
MTLGDSLDSGEYLEGPNSRRRRERDRYRFRDRDDRGYGMPPRPRSPVGRLIAGIFIAGWGLSTLFDNLGFGELRQYMHRLWPAAFVIVGVTMLVNRDSNPARYGFWGTVFLMAGTWMYLDQRDWFHLSLWSVVWPLAIVVFGVSFVYRGLRRSSHVP